MDEGTETCGSDINNTRDASSVVCWDHDSRCMIFKSQHIPHVQAIYRSTGSRSTPRLQPNRQTRSIISEKC